MPDPITNSTARLIDAHHHLWRYTTEEYGWISDDMAAIRRDFLPGELEETLRASGIDGCVTVQARQSLEETEWLLDLAAKHPFIRGVVGWAPLASAEFPAAIEALLLHPKLKGLRHIVQAEPDSFLLGTDFNRGIAAMRGTGLLYDILIFERQLPMATQFVDCHPQQVFVLDHIAKPLIKDAEISPWRENIVEFARRPNVYCKLSGMVTEADFKAWTPAGLKPYFDVVLEAFGPARLMMGSDWPVCLVACGYPHWIETVRSWIAPLTTTEQQRILGGTAIEAYHL